MFYRFCFVLPNYSKILSLFCSNKTCNKKDLFGRYIVSLFLNETVNVALALQNLAKLIKLNLMNRQGSPQVFN